MYISDASCDYILVTNTSMLLGNISGNKDDYTAVRLSRESFIPRTSSVPLALNVRIYATRRDPSTRILDKQTVGFPSKPTTERTV